MVEIIVFCLLLAAPLAGYLFGYTDPIAQNEKRQRIEWPELPNTLDQWSGFPQRFEAHFNDYFGFRDRLVYWHHRIKFAFGVSPHPDVVLGKNGWLFYAADDIAAYHRNLSVFSDTQLLRLSEPLRRRQRWLAQQGIAYLLVIAPDKHTIYPEYLPSALQPEARPSLLDQFLQYMEKNAGAIRILDLRPALQAAKQDRRLYFKTDTHWNLAGANIAQYKIIETLARSFPTLQPTSHPWEKLPSLERPGGDLAKLLGLQQELVEARPALRLAEERIPCIQKRASATLQAYFNFKDAAFETICPDRLLRVLMLRDSFSVHLQPFLSHQFGRMFYLWRSFADHRVFFQYVQSEKPDIVIEQLTERSLFPKYDEKTPAL